MFKKNHDLAVGGQALMEGVLFRGKNKTAMAVRKPDGEIYLNTFDQKPITSISRIYALPIIRGAVTLFDALKTGMKMLAMSADISEGDEANPMSKKRTRHNNFLLRCFFSILLFFVLPTLLSGLISRFLAESTFLNNLIEGIFTPSNVF